jgi:hypothetical protein
VSFDDSIESLCAGLSSYSFNTPAIILAILDHVCNPRWYGKRPHPPMEITGSVMKRESSNFSVRK